MPANKKTKCACKKPANKKAASKKQANKKQSAGRKSALAAMAIGQSTLKAKSADLMGRSDSSHYNFKIGAGGTDYRIVHNSRFYNAGHPIYSEHRLDGSIANEPLCGIYPHTAEFLQQGGYAELHGGSSTIRKLIPKKLRK